MPEFVPPFGLKGALLVGGQTVLIVEAEVRIVHFMDVALSIAGYRVIQTDSGTEAIQLALQEGPDLVILDARLPDMEGFDVLRRLRSSTHAPVIMISTQAGHSHKAKASGATEFLPEPFSPCELIKRIEAHLPTQVIA